MARRRRIKEKAPVKRTYRKRVRDMQNEIVRLAYRVGYKPTMRVSQYMPEDITLEKLEQFIYPEYEVTLGDVLEELKRRI